MTETAGWWGRVRAALAGRSGAGRWQLVDVLRGVAIVVMVAYHVGWDLFILGAIETDITNDPVWITVQRLILGTFLVLTGASLVLAHRDGIRWRAFWRREAILVVSALLVTAGTYAAFPDYFAYFGVLHAIAVFSLLALPLVRAPLWVVPLAAAAAGLAPLAFRSTAFESRWLAWIGFWPELPPTVDLVAIFPWFAVTALGVALTRIALGSPWRERLAAWRGGPVARALAALGRWSLLIYLLHQPILYGALSVAVPMLLPVPLPLPAALTQEAEFSAQCTPKCVAAGGTEEQCVTYCGCALEQIEQGDLWDAVGAPEPTPEELQQTQAVVRLCKAMVGVAD